MWPIANSRALRLTGVGLAALCLQGCIAAALPIAAGGLMASRTLDGGSEASGDQNAASQSSQAELASAEAEATSPEIAATSDVSASALASDTATIVVHDEQSDPEPEPTPPPIAANAETKPAPENEPAKAQVPANGNMATLFDPLYEYASSAEFRGQEDRLSAVLSNPTSLDGERKKCAPGTPATVLIDLDPGKDSLLPVDAGSASPALAQRLVQLRNQGVAIAWISRTAVAEAGNIRVTLVRSGLDGLGNDRLLLIGEPDDRKQTLRDQLSKMACVVAIAGDEKSDFHELYDYLLNPSDAALLEGLFGNGWFTIPTPLLPERPAP